MSGNELKENEEIIIDDLLNIASELLLRDAKGDSETSRTIIEAIKLIRAKDWED